MTVRWDLMLIPSFLFTFILLAVSQVLFLEGSFYKDLGLGRTGDSFDLVNYVRVFTDGFYLTTL